MISMLWYVRKLDCIFTLIIWWDIIILINYIDDDELYFIIYLSTELCLQLQKLCSIIM